MRNGIPAREIFCLARVSRFAIVASGTRNAVAISRVVRPPTARSVSGIAVAGVSDGWQHMNIRISVSSRPVGRLRGGCGDERFLHRVFRVGEIAVATHDGTEDLRRQPAQPGLGARRVGHSSSGSGAPMI